MLNKQRLWTGKDRLATDIANDLQKKMAKLSDLYITPDGRGVDYAACAQSAAFRAYRVAAMELQQADLSGLSGDNATAFWLNLYNALIIHANISIGPPRNMIERSRFFGSLGYYIGGYKYTLSEIEHAILRGNRKPPASFSRLFKRNDPRMTHVIPNLDPRIHFALVCGAKSCPPIRVYDAKNLDTALQWATEGFCSEEVIVNEAKRTVTLSRIFQWYAKDFGRKPKQVLWWIVDYLPEDDRNALKRLLTGKVKIKYSTYDWDTNNRYGEEEAPTTDSLDINSDQSNYSITGMNSLGGLDSPRECFNTTSPSTSRSVSPALRIGSRLVNGRGSLRQQNFQAWEIDFNAIELFEQIGKGGFGEVHRGEYQGQKVAVKRILLNDKLSRKESTLFFQEISIMR